MMYWRITLTECIFMHSSFPYRSSIMTGTPWITPGKATTPYRAQSHVASTVANILSRPPTPDPSSRTITKTVEINYLIDVDETCGVDDALESLLKDDEVAEDISISGYITITATAVPDGW